MAGCERTGMGKVVASTKDEGPAAVFVFSAAGLRIRCVNWNVESFKEWKLVTDIIRSMGDEGAATIEPVLWNSMPLDTQGTMASAG